MPSADGGIRLTVALEPPIQVFSSFLGRYPLSVSEQFALALAGQDPIKVTLHPAAKPQYRASLGLDIYRFLVVFSYESWVWDKSDVSHQYYQPESSRQEVGVRVRYAIGF